MNERLTDITWRMSVRISLVLTCLGAAIGGTIGLIIGIYTPNFYDLLFAAQVANPAGVGFFLGLGNGAIGGIVLGFGFLIATGIAQKGSSQTPVNPFTNYPRTPEI